MNCHDFSQRLHDRLDARVSVDSDRALQKHAADCDSCRAELNAWKQIASIMPAASVKRRPWRVGKRHLAMALGLAAAMLIALTWLQDEPKIVAGLFPQSSAALAISATTVQNDQHEKASDLNPVAWWQDVRNHDWIGQTMPAVESVRDGVAPLGRSLMRAVSLLSVGGGNRTS